MEKKIPEFLYNSLGLIMLFVGSAIIGVSCEIPLLGIGVFVALYGSLLMVGTIIKRIKIHGSFTATVEVDEDEVKATHVE